MTWKPIVVGVDGSPESRGALELASELAHAARAKLVAVYALPDLWLAGNLDQTPIILPAVYEALVRDGRAAIRTFLHDALPAARHLSLEVRTGTAATAIAAVARRQRAGLVVLGGKHHAALARGLGRSTAHYLVRTLDVPLLVADQSSATVTRVLAAVDLSAAAAPTIQAAAGLAALLGARLRVVHVVEPLRVLYLPIAPLDQEGFERLSRETFDRLLEAFPQIGADDRVVRTGMAAETIAEEVAAWRPNVLVLGSHGKGWVNRLLVGSTTERLLNVLPTSLLVIPTGRPARRQQIPRPRRERPALKLELTR
jgi:nucleotide-binding universal stress UspA family protein